MATIKPFAALRPPASRVALVAAPPYDVINAREARALAGDNRDSYLYVSRPEIALDPSVDEHDDKVYAQGRVALEDFVARGVLVRDAEPELYVYAQKMGSHRQVGLVACASVAEYDDATIKRHENTRADKEDDRTRHIDELSAHDEPVFLTYRADALIDATIAKVERTQPVYDFATADGVEHTLWIAPRDERAALVRAFAERIPVMYIADGHHRSAAASRVHKLRKERGETQGEHDVYLAVLFPHDQMQILPYNRLVKSLGEERSAEATLAALRAVMDVVETDAPAPSEPKSVGLYVGGRWYRGSFRPGSWNASDPVASLDCSIVQAQILAPLFSVTDPRKDKHVDFVGGIRGARELEKRCAEERWALAIHMYPTRIEELLAVSDAGLLMPPKSTWFEPKLRSGLFVHAF
ncbi:MAG: DUF1015 domain-containing protein [Myxococcales bacterium]|nr:DUF1015 domain-containing protein [Myxococcales bacterium]